VPAGRVFPAAVLAASVAAGIVAASLAAGDERVVHVTARQFEFEPSRIVLKRGEAVRLDLESADRLHGFSVPGLGIRTEIPPGQVVSIRFTPPVAGSFAFVCDAFCGTGHDDMDGRIIVTD
jgi:cytochrome c oxidase subunit 2